MNEFIKNLIAQYKNATEQIPVLTNMIENIIEDEDANTVIGKANLVNLTITLRGFKLVAEGVENLLANQGYVIGSDGVYKKLDANDLENRSKSNTKREDEEEKRKHE